LDITLRKQPEGRKDPARRRFSQQARTLQRIDRLAGVPLCLALTVLRRIWGLFRPAPGALPIKSILFIKLAEQGSTVLAHRAIREAAGKVGADRVFFLVFEENRFVVDALGLIPEANVVEVRTGSAWSLAASLAKGLIEIRRQRIDACIDMEFFARGTAILSFLTGIPVRVGFHSYFGEGPFRGDLLTHRVPYNPHLHTSLAFLSLVRALDADRKRLPTFDFAPDAPEPPPGFRPTDADRAAARSLTGEVGIPAGAPIVLLNANAGDLLPLRRWDGGNYVELAKRLLARFPDLFVAFTGTGGERPAVAALAGQVGSPRCAVLAGRTSLRELLAVYGLSEVLVTNDSGPAHFASLTDIDTVVLFGPETPLLFAAPGPRTHSLWAGIACSPCVNAFNNRQTACRDNVCMQRIGVDQVFDLVCGIYLRRRPPSA
jgi:ADP-heptose:LPS heptosyltransferase